MKNLPLRCIITFHAGA